jgi:hypothetical protein
VRRLPALLALLVTTALLTLGVSCGPESPTEEGGPPAQPVPLLAVLPSPGDLRGPPAARADAAALAVALTGKEDPDLARRLDDRGLRAAGVRTWTGPDGQELTAAVSVWDSHLIATGIGADSSGFLQGEPGARAWTPPDVPASRGVRVDDPERRELRLAIAEGPNAIYVRATGPVPEDVVVRQVERLQLALRGQEG